MNNKLPIQDLLIHELDATDSDGVVSLPLISFDDHLLRRFGFAESIFLPPNFRSDLKIREIADEVWICMKGSVQFHWRDLREGSPSFHAQFSLQVDQPTLALVPFGIAFGVQTHEVGCTLIRFSTHAENSLDGDRSIPWEKD